MMTTVRRSWIVLVVAIIVVAAGRVVSGQEAKSAALAKELAQALNDGKLDSVAAKEGAAADQFVSALFVAGQLMVVSGKYSAPTLLVPKIASKNYKEVYSDLQGASDPKSRVFVTDLGADGLKVKPEANQPFDTYESAGKAVAFNGDWEKQKLSEEDYTKAFSTADGIYSSMLTALLAELKGKK